MNLCFARKNPSQSRGHVRTSGQCQRKTESIVSLATPTALEGMERRKDCAHMISQRDMRMQRGPGLAGFGEVEVTERIPLPKLGACLFYSSLRLL